MFDSLGFTIADVIAVIIVIIGLIVGLRQGLSGQMTILLTSLVIWCCFTYGFESLHTWLSVHFSMPHATADLATRIALVVLPILAGMLIYLLLRYLFKITFTTWVDRIGGSLAGGVTAAGVVLLVFMLLSVLPPEKRPEVVSDKSWITREVIGTESQVVQRIMSRVQKGESMIQRARDSKAGKREKWED